MSTPTDPAGSNDSAGKVDSLRAPTVIPPDGNMSDNQRKQVDQGRAIIWAAVVTAVGTVVGIVVGIVATAIVNNSGADDPPTIEITSPSEGSNGEPATINLRDDVKGEVENLPAGHTVWLFDQPGAEGNELFIHQGPCDVDSDDKFVCQGIYTGEDTSADVGREFKLFASIVSPAQQRDLIGIIGTQDPPLTQGTNPGEVHDSIVVVRE